jgi:hypothetical protein
VPATTRVPPSTRVPVSVPDRGKRISKERGKGTVAKASPGPPNRGLTSIGRQKDKPKGTVARISCPPRMRPNPRGTGCVPALNMPGISGVGSARRLGGTPGRFPGIAVPSRTPR